MNLDVEIISIFFSMLKHIHDNNVCKGVVILWQNTYFVDRILTQSKQKKK